MREQGIIIAKGLADLMSEMEKYPQTTDKDLLDALAQGFDVTKVPTQHQTIPGGQEDDFRERDVKRVKSTQVPQMGTATTVLREN